MITGYRLTLSLVAIAGALASCSKVDEMKETQKHNLSPDAGSGLTATIDTATGELVPEVSSLQQGPIEQPLPEFTYNDDGSVTMHLGEAFANPLIGQQDCAGKIQIQHGDRVRLDIPNCESTEGDQQ